MSYLCLPSLNEAKSIFHLLIESGFNDIDFTGKSVFDFFNLDSFHKSGSKKCGYVLF